MSEEAEKFYLVWAKKAQLPNGAWQQRYYLDAKLAPAWGVQIDEVATREWYEKADEWNCECEDCRHFIDLIKTSNEKIIELTYVRNNDLKKTNLTL